MVNKKPYRIEVWEDKWVAATNDSPDAVKERGGYWEEIRSVCLGSSDNQDFLGRAFNAVLTRDVTGEITFSFSIYGYYYENGKKVRNLLVPYLFNEVKIKLFYDDKWYDFIIKEMNESHDNKGLVYDVSCIYLPMAELSKNGWDISFSLDQENCIGTIEYFTNIILDGTDWTYQPNEDCNLTEYSLEYLYVAQAARAMAVYSIEDYYNPTSVRKTLARNAYVYVPYSQINNTDTIQFIYDDSYSFEENEYTIAKGTMNFSTAASNLVFATDNEGNRMPEMSQYYGYRISRTQETIWEPEISRYSRIYTYTNDSGQTERCYGYDDTKISIDVNLNATVETVTRYYKKVLDSSGNEIIYKLRILYGFGPPNEQSSTVIGTPSYLQKYVDTSTENFQAYVYLNNGWQQLNSEDYDGSKMKIGEEEIVYFNEILSTDLPNLTPIYLEKNEKQRSLVDEKSNRFNLIQKLAELFEVWADFEIQHEADGRIKLNPETGLPYKILTFKTEFGKDNYAGFSYEINISGISRTIDSNSLATKMYVEVVDNENAENGICSIQTADNNLGKELFLINLDYYSQMGMIDRNKLLKDLYGTTSNDLGYLTNLGRLNTLYTEETEKRDGTDGLAIQISMSQEKVLFYTDAVAAAEKELEDLLEKEQNGLTYSESLNIEELKQKAQQTLYEAQDNLNAEKQRLENFQNQLDEITATLKNIEEEKEQLNATFYNIYSRFLQEGTWQGTDYIDPNSYYLDATKVLLESSRPSVEYDINVYDISQAQDFVNGNSYELYHYELGDITYIEDPDYFGYDSTGRPYREKVIVSTIENNLDSPQSDKITIQNYKTRFEDLFQRTTATVQSYNLNKNMYDRVDVIEATNSIKHDTLQNTLANNSFILSQSKTNSVIIDDAGIEVSNLNDYSQKVRIVAGGIFISNDGGVTWNSGITGAGINTKYLLAGQIDVEKINIMNGSFPTFSWDKYGINAFSWAEDNETGISYGYYSSFIRYDQYGIYGIRNSQFGTELPFIPDHSYNIAADGTVTDSGTTITGINNVIENIKKFSQFSLTWNGFNLKTDNGSIEIDSNKDIRVLDNNGNQRVKLGEIGLNLYGLVLSDGQGKVTLQSNSDGNLSLTGKIYLGSETNEASQATVAIGDLGVEEIVSDYLNRNRRILVQKDPTEGGGQPIPTFVVYDTGEIYLAGGITAEYGDIGGFIIEDNRLYSDDVILSPNGITLYGGKLNIYNNNNEQVLYADNNGNIVGNNLTVNGGTFNNIQVSANGTFNGTITATRGLLNGSLILGTKQPIFVLSSASSYLSDTDLIGTVNLELSNTQDLAVDLNNDRNNYYFVQTNVNSAEEIFLFKLTQVSVGDSIEVVLQLIHNDNYSTITAAILESLSFRSDTFYRLANNNIVLDGQTGNIYTFDYYIEDNGYRLSGNGNISGKNLTLGTNSTININDDGIDIKVNGTDGSVFSVDADGTLTTNRINITGNSNNRISGNLYVGTDNNGIIISGSNGSIYNNAYNTSGGASGWIVNDNGSAVFTDVTVRGRIESSTFIQNEIQALSGTLIIRPTLTFLDNSTITYSDGTYIGYTNEEPGIIDADYYQITHNGASYNFILRRKTYISSMDAWEIRLQRVGSNLEIPSNIRNEFIELPVINIGNATQNTIGISLNATSNNTTFGFADSITIYDQNITTNNTDEFEFKRNNRLVMGRLPYEESLIPTSMQGSFGLYADNVYLKGAMVSATGTKDTADYMTSGINTDEENGNVFWAGANGDDAQSIANAPFRVTEDGFLYAQKGLFEGEVNAAIIRTAQIIGRDKDSSLRVMTYPDSEGYISFEQYLNTTIQTYDGEGQDNYKVTAKLSGQQFKIAAPVIIYSDGQIGSTSIPSLMSFEGNNFIGLNSLLVYNFYSQDSNYFTSGWGIKENSIYFRNIQNNSEAINNIATNYRDRAVELDNALASRYDIFNIKMADTYDSIDFQLNNQSKARINSDNVNIYNNLILNDMTGEGIQCSFKISTEFDEDEGTNIVTGYDLFIEES